MEYLAVINFLFSVEVENPETRIFVYFLIGFCASTFLTISRGQSEEKKSIRELSENYHYLKALSVHLEQSVKDIKEMIKEIKRGG